MFDTYQEHLDHEAGAASESQNCFTEAQDVVAELSANAEHFGEGPVLVRVEYPYYCRATDAFAGMVLHEVHHCADGAAARLVARRLTAVLDSEWSVTWRDPAPAPAPVLATDDFDLF